MQSTATASIWSALRPNRPNRVVIALMFLVLAVVPGDLGALTRSLMFDAYTQVSAFVAATLLIFYGAERAFKINIGDKLSRAGGWQVPMAAILGATPGCGGAVVVVAAYSAGHVRFGAVVATLTATMGDAAFLLIATRPDAAMVVLPLSVGVGVLSGWIVDLLGAGPRVDAATNPAPNVPLIGRLRKRDLGYFALIIPGLVMGIAQLFQIDLAHWVPETALLSMGLAGTAIGLFIWATSPLVAMTNAQDAPITRMAEETSFISIWVIGAYLAYDYAVTYAGLDVAGAFETIGPLLPLMGVLVGLVPGCGPQVLVTTLYINGMVPFAALIGNAISNDGDALFPAIAINPRAAFWATAYSTVPALIVAYGFYLLAPGFLN